MRSAKTAGKLIVHDFTSDALPEPSLADLGLVKSALAMEKLGDADLLCAMGEIGASPLWQQALDRAAAELPKRCKGEVSGVLLRLAAIAFLAGQQVG